ncbi:hypothetical protein EDB86DRAFT_3099248 [Lactarius hatsudake]|nr:hypothetical protein EDB86DRAFT_3099248 [Lactarius hatsudake]
MSLSNLTASKGGIPRDVVTKVKAINDGIRIEEASVVFSFSLATYLQSTDGALTSLSRFTKDGSVHTTKGFCTDTAYCDVGDRRGGRTFATDSTGKGGANKLCGNLLDNPTHTPHEFSRTLGILTDGLKNSWQNSEDMERMLTTALTFILHQSLNDHEPGLLHITSLRSISSSGLGTRGAIQRIHLEHFLDLTVTSRYKHFNVRQQLAGLLSWLLFRTPHFPALRPIRAFTVLPFLWLCDFAWLILGPHSIFRLVSLLAYYLTCLPLPTPVNLSFPSGLQSSAGSSSPRSRIPESLALVRALSDFRATRPRS